MCFDRDFVRRKATDAPSTRSSRPSDVQQPVSHVEVQLVICGYASPKPTGVDSKVFLCSHLCKNLCTIWSKHDSAIMNGYVTLLYFTFLFFWPLRFSCIVDFLYNVEKQDASGCCVHPAAVSCIIMLNIHVLLAKWTQIYTHVLQAP